jgi:hypothetical protein
VNEHFITWKFEQYCAKKRVAVKLKFVRALGIKKVLLCGARVDLNAIPF